jgi:hypothetical protein
MRTASTWFVVAIVTTVAACTKADPPVQRGLTGQPTAPTANLIRPAAAVAQAEAVPVVRAPEFPDGTDFETELAGWTEYTLQRPMPEYPLNELGRNVPAKGRLVCPDVTMVDYRSKKLNYGKSLRVYEGLVPHIEEMEATIIRVANSVYGRPPSHLQTLGTLNCRRMRTYPTYLSEHAFANAIDLAGFQFPAATKAQRANITKALWGAQSVTVLGDWKGGRGNKAVHQRFLHALILELIKQDTFRLYLGPGFPGHEDHFHLDMSNFRMIDL